MMSMNHPPHQRQHDTHRQSGNHDQQRFLDLDSEVFGDNLKAVLDLAEYTAAHNIIDLGAGTGAGSRLLRDRYPDASMTCVDNDPHMLELLRQQGFTALEADLDDGFPTLERSITTAAIGAEAPLDLIWASSSLHHVAHPTRLLSEARKALAPDGVLIVVELTALPRFLNDPRGKLLEQRCHTAAAAEGWNHHKNWAPVIEAAGLNVAQSEVATPAPVTPAAREYAKQWFTRFSHLAGLTPEDRYAVEQLVDKLSDDFELEPRTTRTVWIATPQ